MERERLLFLGAYRDVGTKPTSRGFTTRPDVRVPGGDQRRPPLDKLSVAVGTRRRWLAADEPDRRSSGMSATDTRYAIVTTVRRLPTQPNHCVALRQQKAVPRVGQAADLGEVQGNVSVEAGRCLCRRVMGVKKRTPFPFEQSAGLRLRMSISVGDTRPCRARLAAQD
jgi:hypothetical protein